MRNRETQSRDPRSTPTARHARARLRSLFGCLLVVAIALTIAGCGGSGSSNEAAGEKESSAEGVPSSEAQREAEFKKREAKAEAASVAETQKLKEEAKRHAEAAAAQPAATKTTKSGNGHKRSKASSGKGSPHAKTHKKTAGPKGSKKTGKHTSGSAGSAAEEAARKKFAAEEAAEAKAFHQLQQAEGK